MKTILSLFPGLMSGKRLADEGELKMMVELLFSTQAGIVAGNVPPIGPTLSAAYNQVISGSVAYLPPALAGRSITIINDNNSSDLVIFPQPSNAANDGKPDIIGDGSTNGDVPTTTAAIFVSYVTGQWVEIGAIFAPSTPPVQE